MSTIYLQWALSKLKEMHLRRYNLRRSALEFFLCDFTNYFINLTSKVCSRCVSHLLCSLSCNWMHFVLMQTRYKVYSQILRLRPPNLIHSNSRSPAELLKLSGLTQRWVGWEISNYDYLMQVIERSKLHASEFFYLHWCWFCSSTPLLEGHTTTSPSTLCSRGSLLITRRRILIWRIPNRSAICPSPLEWWIQKMSWKCEPNSTTLRIQVVCF